MSYMCIPGFLFANKGKRLYLLCVFLATQTEICTPWLKKDHKLISRKNQTVEKVTLDRSGELYSYYELSGGKKHTFKISDN